MGTNEQFSDINASAQRTNSRSGGLRLEGVKNEYPGRAGYIGFGTLIVDCVKNDVIKAQHTQLGFGKFKKREKLTLENVERFLAGDLDDNDSAERQ